MCCNLFGRYLKIKAQTAFFYYATLCVCHYVDVYIWAIKNCLFSLHAPEFQYIALLYLIKLDNEGTCLSV